MSAVLHNLGSIAAFKGSTPRDRINVMFQYVSMSIRDPLARTLAARATMGCPSTNEVEPIAADWCNVQAIYWYFRNHGKYEYDVREIDTYQTLRRTWELGIGDCDDAVIGLMSMLISIGFRAGAKIIAQDGSNFRHTYAVVELPRENVTVSNRRIIPLDATVKSAVPGWEPDKSQRPLERIYWWSEGSL